EHYTTYPEALAEHGYMVGFTAKGWAPGVAERDGVPRQMTGQRFNMHRTEPPTPAMSNIDYATNFATFLDSAAVRGEPFAFWYGGLEPHRRYTFGSGEAVGGKSKDDIDAVPGFWPDRDSVRTDMLDYAFEIEYFDDHLGRMLAELDARGLLGNTVVVVTADNGMPFPRVKGQVYEMDHHLPLAVMWPEGIASPGRSIDDVISFADFAPTFLELTGLAEASSGMASITGRSFADVFRTTASGQIDEARDYVLLGKERHDVGRPDDQGYPVRGILEGDYLYVRNYAPDRWPAGNPETGYLNTDGGATKTVLLNEAETDSAGYARWALNFGKRPAEELYNVVQDPENLHNLASDPAHAEHKARLRERMETELLAQGDLRVQGRGDLYEQYTYANEATRNFYNRFMAGDSLRAGWVNATDFRAAPQEP
ncbi:MAG: sulfatase-like hydrolase/transferase, partial [Bacteroidota bacterium]